MEHENALFVDYLYEILDTMFDCVKRGLEKEGGESPASSSFLV